MDSSTQAPPSRNAVDPTDTQIGYPAVYSGQSSMLPAYTGYGLYHNSGLAVPQNSWPLLPQALVPICYASSLSVNHPAIPAYSIYRSQTVISIPRDEIKAIVNADQTKRCCKIYWGRLFFGLLLLVLFLLFCLLCN